MEEFLSIFDATQFVPRGHCGIWNPTFKLIYQVANSLIVAAYLAIPLTLLMVKSSYDHLARNNLVRISFVLFILFCGIGHLEGVVSFVWPAYHFFAYWNVLTALVSWWTVILLLRYRDIELPTVKGG